MPFMTDKLKSFETTSDTTSLPVHTDKKQRELKTRFTFQPDSVSEELRKRIFGQDHVLTRITDMLEFVYADITEKSRPLYVVMLLGPTGVGKTETVNLIAQSIYGDSQAYSRIDMNTLSQEHYAAAITGAPPGYIGSKEGATLFQEEKISGTFSKPGIILFDEVEKADRNVLQSLLNVFDNGKLILANGDRTIDFRNSIIFMTSNLGSKQILELADSRFKKGSYKLRPSNWRKSDQEILQTIIKKELEKAFPPEFINRIDDTIIFNWLGKNDFEPVLDRQISDLNDRLKKHHCQVTLTPSAKTYIIKKGFDKQYGARSMKREIRKLIEIPLAKKLRNQRGNSSFIVTVRDQALHFEEDEGI